jgi:deoxycytidylate deaminase
VTEEQLQAVEAACKAKRALHWERASLLLAEARRLRATLERIAAGCAPERETICPCLNCTRQTLAWMIAREALEYR